MGTRRARKGMRLTRRSTDLTTVESLHASFEKLDGKVRKVVERGSPDTAVASVIRQTWREQFHDDVSETAVKGLIQHYRTLYGRNKTRRASRRGQRGGMAPLDWTLGQGTTAAVYGRFPVEMGTAPAAIRALDLNRFFESPISRSCDSTGGAPAPGQKGGSLVSAIGIGHVPATAVPGALDSFARAVSGMTPLPSADPVQPAWSLSRPIPVPYDPTHLTEIKGLTPVGS